MSMMDIDMRDGRADASRSDFQLSAEEIEFFKENGFLVVENAVSADEVQAMRDDAVKICRGGYGEFRGFAGPHDGQSDDEVMQQYLCIHFPHKISDVMKRNIKAPNMVKTLTGVVGPDVKCMQSMLFIKAAGKPGQAWHQDEYYIPTRDRSLIGGWIALDDATVDNGCLWVIPGSHQHGVLWPQREHMSKAFDCTGEAHKYPYSDEDSIPVEVKSGSIVFFNGYLLHRSLKNQRTTGYRRCLVNHYMSASSLLPWRPEDNAPIALTDYRDVEIVAGTDPYAWKGYEDIAEPHVRPSGEGGCERWVKGDGSEGTVDENESVSGDQAAQEAGVVA